MQGRGEEVMGSGSSTGTGSKSKSGMINGRSASEKEKTKMRERQRRSITTKIFHGLRKHGGYRLSPRADINEVLRELAKEAGWVVDTDGTTYRSTATATENALPNLCPLCDGTGKTSRTPTPTSSVIGGDCPTAATPRSTALGDPLTGFGGLTPLYYSGGGSGCSGSTASSSDDVINPLSLYMYRRLAAGGIHPPSTAACCGGPLSSEYNQQQLMHLQEARASNQNTPVGSPQHRA